MGKKLDKKIKALSTPLNIVILCLINMIMFLFIIPESKQDFSDLVNADEFLRVIEFKPFLFYKTLSQYQSTALDFYLFPVLTVEFLAQFFCFTLLLMVYSRFLINYKFRKYHCLYFAPISWFAFCSLQKLVLALLIYSYPSELPLFVYLQSSFQILQYISLVGVMGVAVVLIINIRER